MIINVLRNNQSIYMREQPFGGNQLTQEIQRHYNLSPEEAEAAKRNGGLPDTFEGEVLNPFMETLALEVTRALQFFFTSTQFNQVNHIFLSGGCATIPGLDHVVAHLAEVNKIAANPFANMEVEPKIKQRQLAQDAPRWS
jgi:type IV pilus assembly protein PilM